MKNKIRKMLALLPILIIPVLMTGCSKKKNGGGFDFSGVEPKNINPWDYISNNAISLNGPLRDLASSSGTLAMTLSIMGIVFSIFYMAIRLFMNRSAALKEEIKQEVVFKSMVAIMIFSVAFWLGLFKYFAELLI